MLASSTGSLARAVPLRPRPLDWAYPVHRHPHVHIAAALLDRSSGRIAARRGTPVPGRGCCSAAASVVATLPAGLTHRVGDGLIGATSHPIDTQNSPASRLIMLPSVAFGVPLHSYLISGRASGLPKPPSPFASAISTMACCSLPSSVSRNCWQVEVAPRLLPWAPCRSAGIAFGEGEDDNYYNDHREKVEAGIP